MRTSAWALPPFSPVCCCPHVTDSLSHLRTSFMDGLYFKGSSLAFQAQSFSICASLRSSNNIDPLKFVNKSVDFTTRFSLNDSLSIIPATATWQRHEVKRVYEINNSVQSQTTCKHFLSKGIGLHVIVASLG